MSEEITRRKLLRMGAGTAALGAAGSLSGCSAIQDLLPGGGGGLGNYANWVYEPDAFESDQENLNASAEGYKAMLSNSGNLSEIAVLTIKNTSYPEYDINVEDVDMDLSLPEGRVITGSFDTEAVKSELTASRLSTPEGSLGSRGPRGSTEYESDSTYNDDYEIFVQSEPEESPTAVAVGNGTVVEGQRVSNFANDSSEVSATEVVEGIIDTGTNGDSRFTDSDDTFGTLVDTLNNGVSVSVNTWANPVGSDGGENENIAQGRFEGVVASGSADSINGDTTERQFVYVYDSEGDVNEGDIQDWIEANDTGNGTLSSFNDISVSVDGNTATVTATVDTIEYRSII